MTIDSLHQHSVPASKDASQNHDVRIVRLTIKDFAAAIVEVRAGVMRVMQYESLTRNGPISNGDTRLPGILERLLEDIRPALADWLNNGSLSDGASKVFMSENTVIRATLEPERR